ncbi:hypothetical protein ACI0FM_00015 [Paenochrobactrum sp. BZR 588]|uniref:hypothetical protein n=1 Tax=unclassified Paenochrobactrum TaxID=2639760 RepID=UPI0038551B73
MSDRDHLLAILKGHTASSEALEGIAKSVSLSCFDLIAQGESGLEIRRLLGRFVENNCNAEMQLIDFLRGFGDQPPMSATERRDYRLKRVEDMLDVTDAAYEKLNDYANGRAA